MKRKYVLLVLIVFISQVFVSNFAYVKAEANTSICAGPSETMSLYFDFQNEMRTVLLGSEINERRFAVHLGTGGIFSQQVLPLATGTAMNLVANSLRNRSRAAVSSATTSAILIALASVSLAQSTTVGLTVLFRDRPIVRDYKTMMDIESELYDVVYFRSKQINMALPVEGDMLDRFNTVVEKYQDLGLLSTNNVTDLKENATMVDIIWDLLMMNAAMEIFIVYDSKNVLDNYQGCMNRSRSKCTPVLKFSNEATANLKSDYKGTFGKCNSNFKSSMSKIASSFIDSQESGWKDVENAMERLKQALVGGGKNKSKNNKVCDDLSDYEMAQVRAYRGNDWTCEETVKLYTSIPDVSIKKANRELNKNDSTSTDEETSNDRVNSKETTSEKIQEWFYIYGSGVAYNPEYSLKMYKDFEGVYNSIMSDYNQSILTAKSSDLSRELIKIEGLIKEVEAVEKQSEPLEKSLKKIADYQCAG